MSKKRKERSYSMKSLYYWMVGHRTRVNYWGCSKFATWVREKTGVNKKPNAATSEGWKNYHDENKEKFGYWLTEELFDNLQDIWMFIPDVIRRVRIYIRNRYIDKPHYLDTKLEKGEWHEFDTRLLHGMFEALVTFVEDEKASMHRWTSDEKFKLPNAEKGIAYLEWEISLKDDYGPEDAADEFKEGIHKAHLSQSQRAQETLDLYNWWKHTRPLREDPYDVVGLTAYYDKERAETGEDGLWSIMGRKRDAEDEAEWKRLHDASLEEEVRQYEEDTDMMIRLVKLRQDLWT